MTERSARPGSADALVKAGIAQYLFGHLGPAVGAGQRLSIFLGRPCLELIEQSFGSCPIDFGLILNGGFKGGSQFIAQLAPRHGLSTGG